MELDLNADPSSDEDESPPNTRVKREREEGSTTSIEQEIAEHSASSPKSLCIERVSQNESSHTRIKQEQFSSLVSSSISNSAHHLSTPTNLPIPTTVPFNPPTVVNPITNPSSTNLHPTKYAPNNIIIYEEDPYPPLSLKSSPPTSIYREREERERERERVERERLERERLERERLEREREEREREEREREKRERKEREREEREREEREREARERETREREAREREAREREARERENEDERKRYQLEEQLLRARAEARRNELFLTGANLEIFMTNNNDEKQEEEGESRERRESGSGEKRGEEIGSENRYQPPQKEDLDFAIEIRSMLFCIPIIALANQARHSKDYGAWVTGENSFKFYIYKTEFETKVIVDSNGNCIAHKANLDICPTNVRYDSEKQIVILEFGTGFRFDFDQIDFVISHRETKRSKDYPLDGYGLLKETIYLEDFSSSPPSSSSGFRQVKISGKFNEEDEDESLKDFYVDLNRYQLSDKSKSNNPKCSKKIFWFMNARKIKSDENWRFCDLLNPQPILPHEFDVGEVYNNITND